MSGITKLNMFDNSVVLNLLLNVKMQITPVFVVF